MKYHSADTDPIADPSPKPVMTNKERLLLHADAGVRDIYSLVEKKTGNVKVLNNALPHSGMISSIMTIITFGSSIY
jgi:hypothetical protein